MDVREATFLDEGPSCHQSETRKKGKEEMGLALTVTVTDLVVSSPSLTTSLLRSVVKSVDSRLKTSWVFCFMNPLVAAPFSKI